MRACSRIRNSHEHLPNELRFKAFRRRKAGKTAMIGELWKQLCDPLMGIKPADPRQAATGKGARFPRWPRNPRQAVTGNPGDGRRSKHPVCQREHGSLAGRARNLPQPISGKLICIADLWRRYLWVGEQCAHTNDPQVGNPRMSVVFIYV